MTFRRVKVRRATWTRGAAECRTHFVNSNERGKRVVVMLWQDGTNEVEVRAITGTGWRPRRPSEALVEFHTESLTAPTEAQIDAAVQRAARALA